MTDHITLDKNTSWKTRGYKSSVLRFLTYPFRKKDLLIFRWIQVPTQIQRGYRMYQQYEYYNKIFLVKRKRDDAIVIVTTSQSHLRIPACFQSLRLAEWF